jgi:hypothetical protein
VPAPRAAAEGRLLPKFRSSPAAPAVSASAAAPGTAASLACGAARTVAAWSVHARTIATWSVHARTVAPLACCRSRAIAAWSVDARTVAARSVDARPIGPLAHSNSRPAPTTPSYRPAPAQAATPAKAALIPTRSTPTGVVPAKLPPSPKELNRVHGSKFIRCRPQGDGGNHSSMRAPADHCTHDRERGGQCQTDFAHGLFLVGCRSLAHQTFNRLA